MKIDLHVHSNNSDGTMTVLELIEEAKEKKIDCFALTDHDTVQGIEEYQKLDTDYQMIYGIELSTYLNGKSVHILGYFPNPLPKIDELRSYLAEIKEKREKRVQKILTGLKKYFDIEIDYEEVKKNSHGVIARPHIARVISEKYGYTYEEIFEKFLSDDSPAYVEISRLSTKDGIALLKRNHAITVLAHPLFLTDEMVNEIISYGVDGIEVYYSDQNRKKYHKLAEKNHLLETGGSDYHGAILDSEFGTSSVPEESFNLLKEQLDKIV
ncbi:MAG: PHP domain-containing protein [Bacilli bacterium]|nr:PHP domain-containing protein [Bacilli bacterium]